MPLQTSLVEALCSDVSRKLRLASEAETKDDREIVCEEVFCDVTGYLDEAAQAQLGAPGRVPFYVVLAQHYATPKGADSAVAVLHLLQSLYSQGHAAPLVALLLHRWLLIRRAPGRGLPEEQRTRVAIALATGSSELFLGDVHGGKHTFEPLWRSLCYEVILGEEDPVPQMVQHTRSGGLPSNGLGGGGDGTMTGLTSLSSTARTALLTRVAAFLVYYAHDDDLEDLLKRFPSPTAPPSPSLPMQTSTSSLSDAADQSRVVQDSSSTDRTWDGATNPTATTKLPPLASPAWGGVNFIMLEITDMLGKIKSEAGLVEYLRAVQRLRGQHALQHPDGMALDTRLKLQSTLSTLASEGGPHYAPRAVRREALAALDSLFPTGLGSRRLVRTLFRLLHPTDWAGDCLSTCLNWMRGLLAAIPLAAFRFLHSLVLWGLWGHAPTAQSEGVADPAQSSGGRRGWSTAYSRGASHQQRRVVAGATGWPMTTDGEQGVSPASLSSGSRWRAGQVDGSAQTQRGSPKAVEEVGRVDRGVSGAAVTEGGDGGSGDAKALQGVGKGGSLHKQVQSQQQQAQGFMTKPPGSPRVIAEQFLAGAKSAVGSTAQAVESGFKAMGAYASSLAGGGKASLEGGGGGVAGGASGAGVGEKDERQRPNAGGGAQQSSITNVNDVLTPGR